MDHDKSGIFCFGQTRECESQYSQLFGCKIGSYPFRNLGIPMHYRKLSNKDWKMIENRIEKRLSSWHVISSIYVCFFLKDPIYVSRERLSGISRMRYLVAVGRK